MANTDLLTEKYYDIFNKTLNEASWWEKIAPYVPFIGGAAKVGAGLYGLDQLIDFGKYVVDKSFQAPKMADKGSERLDAMVAKPGENFGDEAEKRIKALQSDKALWQMSTSKRNTILGREQSMAANINKARMKALKNDPKKKAEYEQAREAYLRTRRDTPDRVKYTKDYSNFTVGQGVGGKPIIVNRTGGYVNPNSAEGRLQAEIDAGRMKDLPRTPGGRIRQGEEMPWEAEEDIMKAREGALGFNPRGMTEDQIRKEMEKRSRAAVDANTEKMRQKAEAEAEKKHGPRWASPRLPQSQLDAEEEIRQGSLGNRGMSGDEYIDELRRRAGLPPLRGGVPPLIAK